VSDGGVANSVAPATRCKKALGLPIEQRVHTGAATIDAKEPTMTTTHAIPATRNEAWGFWGTMEGHAPTA